jgi:aromatase
MGARRGWIPVSWVAEQECSPEAGIIAYRHVGGITRGMQVEWRITPAREGCSVSITHELNRPEGLLRLPLGSWIAARWFITPIADRTLQGIKVTAEAAVGSRAAPAEVS